MVTVSAKRQLLLGELSPPQDLAWPGLARFAPKWFRAITWTIWLHFQIRDRGSAWFFDAHIFVFLAPGTRFGTWGPNFGPGISKFGSGWARDIFGTKMGAGKTWFCLGNGFKIEDMGNPVTQMDCMVSWRCLGELVWPQSLPKNSFQGISRFSRILGSGPGPPCISPIGPLWPVSPLQLPINRRRRPVCYWYLRWPLLVQSQPVHKEIC